MAHKDQNIGRSHQCSQMSQCGFLKKQSSSPINGLLHNPGTNKRIIQTDMSLRTEIIVSNCLIWDFQIYSLCPSRISLNTYHVQSCWAAEILYRGLNLSSNMTSESGGLDIIC